MNVHAAASQDLDLLLGQVATEFFERLSRGEAPQVDEYVQRHPEIAEMIRHALPALQMVSDSIADASSSAPSLGEKHEKRLGDFHILHELGRGGMGIVYEAEQISMGRRKVALKVLPFAAMVDEKRLQRFRNEIRAAASLDHPNIVSVYSVGEERGVHFYAMQLIRGQNLAALINQLRELRQQQNPLSGSSLKDVLSASVSIPPASGGTEPTEDHFAPNSSDYKHDDHFGPRAPNSDTVPEAQGLIRTKGSPRRSEFFHSVAELGIQAAEALEHAHQQGVIHRDIKPANLMVDANAKLYITDFGLAQMEDDVGITMTGDIVGTLRYMSPEQALGKRVAIDHRADIYALGVSLYELLTTEPAFDGENRAALLKQIAFQELRRLRQIDRAIPHDLETIIHKAVTKNPDERYFSAQELADDLKSFRDNQPISARPPSIVDRSRKWVFRNQGLVLAIAIVTLITTIGLAISNSLIASQRNAAQTAMAGEQKQREEAERQRHDAEEQRKQAEQGRKEAEEQKLEAVKQREEAEKNFQRARETVDTFLTKVAHSKELSASGMQPLRKDLLELAIKYYEKLVDERKNDHSLRRHFAMNLYNLGVITSIVGITEEAMRVAQKAFEIRQSLVADHPEEFDYRKDLSWSYNFIGNLHARADRTDQALESLRHAIALQEGLIQEKSEVPDVQRALAKSYRDYANLLYKMGKTTESFTALQNAVDTGKRLSFAHPENASYRALLASCYRQLGVQQRNAGRIVEGREQYQKAIELAEINTREDGSVEHWRNLAGLCSDLGHLELNEASYDVSIEWYKKSNSLLEKLVKENPADASLKSELSRNYVNLGVIFGRSGETTKEAKSCEDAIAILIELVKRDKEKGDDALLLAHSFRNLAHARLVLGQTITAREAILAALAINEDLAKRRPDSPLYRNDHAKSLAFLSSLEARQGRTQEAIALQERALEMLKLTAEQTPNVLENIALLGQEISHLADMYLDVGQIAASLGSYFQAIQILENCKEKNHDINVVLISATMQLGRAQQLSMSQQDAVNSCRSAVKRINSLAEKERTSDIFANLGQAHYYLKEFTAARAALERAIELGGNNRPNAIKERWWYLSMTLHQLGEIKLAREYYDQLTQQLNDNFLGYDYCQFRAETAKVLGVMSSSPLDGK